MGIPILLASSSGKGKTTSIRNMDPKETFLINVLNKPLPFRSKGWVNVEQDKENGNIYSTDNSDIVIAVIKKAVEKGYKNIVIDDGTFILLNEFMNRISEKSFDKFSEIGKHIYNLIDTIKKLPQDVCVVLIWHTEESNYGDLKLKSAGKLVEEKIDIPAQFTISLLANIENGEYVFKTNRTNNSFAKSPMEMFDDIIPNDMNFVINTIRKYYNLTKENK